MRSEELPGVLDGAASSVARIDSVIAASVWDRTDPLCEVLLTVTGC